MPAPALLPAAQPAAPTPARVVVERSLLRLLASAARAAAEDGHTSEFELLPPGPEGLDPGLGLAEQGVRVVVRPKPRALGTYLVPAVVAAGCALVLCLLAVNAPPGTRAPPRAGASKKQW